MIFITNDNIVEVSNWALKGIEVFEEESRFYEILNPIFFKMNKSKDFTKIKDAIEKQIKDNKYYIDLRPLLNNQENK